MNPIKRGRATRLALAALGAVGVLAIFVGVAAATGTPITGSVTITGGALTPTYPSAVAFPAFTLDGLSHTLEDADGTTGDGTFEIKDYTGSGSGWKISAQAADFTCDTNTTPQCSTTRTLPGTTTLTTNGDSTEAGTNAPTVGCQSGVSTDCTTGTSSVSRVTIPIGGSAATIFEQPADSGMGDIKVSGLNWWLIVPPSAYAGQYKSTITLDIATGP